MANVYHFDLWGPRGAGKVRAANGNSSGKYDWLYSHDVSNTQWMLAQPSSPHYLFTPQSQRLLDEYGAACPIQDAMPLRSVGVVAARDHFAIDFSAGSLLEKLRRFELMNVEMARHEFSLGRDARDWKVANAQADVKRHGTSKDYVKQVLYRPFDSRWIYYTGQSRGVVGQPQRRIMQQFLNGPNVGLILPRAIEINRGWEHVFCTGVLAQHHSVSLKEANYVLPLYLYNTDQSSADLFDHDNGRRPNLSSAFVDDIQARLPRLTFIPDGAGDLKKTFGPEDVFHYMYAILHAPSYRARYAEFLKIDFPRVPLTSNIKLFRKLCSHGAALVGLHLMRQDGPRNDMPKFPVDGDNVIDKVRWSAAVPAAGADKMSALQPRVYVNKTQYFEPVPQEVWDFHIGGYRVAEKWLKDRRGLKLVFDEMDHYCRIIAALAETIRQMQAIDTDIEEAGGWPLTKPLA